MVWNFCVWEIVGFRIFRIWLDSIGRNRFYRVVESRDEECIHLTTLTIYKLVYRLTDRDIQVSFSVCLFVEWDWGIQSNIEIYVFV